MKGFNFFQDVNFEPLEPDSEGAIEVKDGE